MFFLKCNGIMNVDFQWNNSLKNEYLKIYELAIKFSL